MRDSHLGLELAHGRHESRGGHRVVCAGGDPGPACEGEPNVMMNIKGASPSGYQQSVHDSRRIDSENAPGKFPAARELRAANSISNSRGNMAMKGVVAQDYGVRFRPPDRYFEGNAMSLSQQGARARLQWNDCKGTSLRVVALEIHL